MKALISILRRLSRLVICMTVVWLVLCEPCAAAPPACLFEGNEKAYEGMVYKARLRCVDPDGDEVAFLVHHKSPDITISADGRLTWTPDAAALASGNYKIYVTVQSGGESKTVYKPVKVFSRLESEHFQVFWQNTFTRKSYAQLVLDSLETGSPNAWDVIINKLKYKQPRCLEGGNKIRVVVEPNPEANVMGSTSASIHTGGLCLPSAITVDTGRTVQEVQATSAHEFFHAVQDAYSWYDFWWSEATAVWAEEQVFDSNNHYVDRFRGPKSIQKQPFKPLTTSNYYAGCLFPIFLTEHDKDVDLVRASYEKMAESTRSIVPVLLDEDMYGLEKFQRLWRDFVLQNEIRKDHLIYSYTEGALYPKPVRSHNLFSGDNLHYVTTLNKRPTFSTAVKVPPVDEIGVGIDNPAFPPLRETLPGLSAMYIRFSVPRQLTMKRDAPSRVFLRFSGHQEALWSCDVIRYKNSWAVETEILKVVDHEKGERVGMIDFPLGGTDPDDTYDFVIVVSNLNIHATPRPFSLTGVVTPVFQDAYRSMVPAGTDRNDLTGTSPSVKNLGPDQDANNKGPDEDSVYRNGDVVSFEVDLSDQIHVGPGDPGGIPRDKLAIDVDFSVLDSAHTPGDEVVRETDPNKHTYTVNYVISKENTLGADEESELVAIPITITSLCRMDGDKESNEAFKVRLDNKAPVLEHVTVTQERDAPPVVVYDSEKQIQEPVVPPGGSPTRLIVKLRFNESMLTHEENGRAAYPKCLLQGTVGELEFTPLGGWTKTNTDNDTWEGEIHLHKGDLRRESERPLSITARDSAGNPVDMEPAVPGAQPDKDHVLLWKSPGLKRLIISQDGEVIYDSEQRIRLEGASGLYHFEAIFDVDMAGVHLSFGQESPYGQHAVSMSPMTGDPALWEGTIFLPDALETIQGAHRVSVSGRADSGFELDADPAQEDAQPDTAHIFLIGAPTAWKAVLKFREDRTRDWRFDNWNMINDGRQEAVFSTDFVIHFQEGPFACPESPQNRDYRTSRDYLAETCSSDASNIAEEITRTLEEIAHYKKLLDENHVDPEGFNKGWDQHLRVLQESRQYAEDALWVLGALRFYSPSFISARADGAHWGQHVFQHIDDVEGITSTSTVKISLELLDCVNERRLEIPEDRPLRRDKAPPFSLVVSTLDRKDFDALRVKTAKYDSGLHMSHVNVDLSVMGLWENSIHFAPNTGQGRYLTLKLDLRRVYEFMAQNGRFAGRVSKDSRGGENEPIISELDVDEPITHFTSRVTWVNLMDDCPKEYPRFDYFGAFGLQGREAVVKLETTPAIRRKAFCRAPGNINLYFKDKPSWPRESFRIEPPKPLPFGELAPIQPVNPLGPPEPAPSEQPESPEPTEPPQPVGNAASDPSAGSAVFHGYTGGIEAGLHPMGLLLGPVNNSVWYEQHYEIRVDGENPNKSGKETLDGVIELDVTVEPLPLGELK